MNPPASPSESGGFVTLARVAKTQGRHGEVAADLLTDFPERFDERHRLFALNERGERRQLELEGFWPHKGRVVLKFVGVDSISDAEALISSEIQIPASERAELEEGANYISDLVGCMVLASVAGTEGERELGPLHDVQFGAGEAALLVIGEGRNEILIPYATEYVKHVDVERRRIELLLPEGMLEINAPLTDEEKKSGR
ncbi:MAG TPA: ribosome maturation factor RimM [Terriglobales bacterium]|nr:ribosome maturation factor RimM [Terriglobales bacterium]